MNSTDAFNMSIRLTTQDYRDNCKNEREESAHLMSRIQSIHASTTGSQSEHSAWYQLKLDTQTTIESLNREEEVLEGKLIASIQKIGATINYADICSTSEKQMFPVRKSPLYEVYWALRMHYDPHPSTSMLPSCRALSQQLVRAACANLNPRQVSVAGLLGAFLPHIGQVAAVTDATVASLVHEALDADNRTDLNPRQVSVAMAHTALDADNRADLNPRQVSVAMAHTALDADNRTDLNPRQVSAAMAHTTLDADNRADLNPRQVSVAMAHTALDADNRADLNPRQVSVAMAHTALDADNRADLNPRQVSVAMAHTALDADNRADLNPRKVSVAMAHTALDADNRADLNPRQMSAATVRAVLDLSRVHAVGRHPTLHPVQLQALLLDRVRWLAAPARLGSKLAQAGAPQCSAGHCRMRQAGGAHRTAARPLRRRGGAGGAAGCAAVRGVSSRGRNGSDFGPQAGACNGRMHWNSTQRRACARVAAGL